MKLQAIKKAYTKDRLRKIDVNIAVQPGNARRGIGAALVGWLEAAARSAGIGQVYLEARAANGAALMFYRRLGYEYAGVLTQHRLGWRPTQKPGLIDDLNHTRSFED